MAQYWYNIEAIVKEIAGAHDTRVKTAKSALESNLDAVKDQGVKDIKGVRKEFDGRLK